MQGGIWVLARLVRPVLGAILRKFWWVVVLAAAFLAGAFAARTYWPKVETRLVTRTVEKAVTAPGETKIIERPVYVTRERVVKVPVEVTRVVQGSSRSVTTPGVVTAPKERIVTVTRPVEVPVEVVKEVWPSNITVTINAVDTVEYGWATPKNPNLVIGMVEPGVYAVPKQEGWSIEKVTTTADVTPPRTITNNTNTDNTHLYIYAGVTSNWSHGTITPEVGVSYRNLAFGGMYEVRASYTFPGVNLGLYWGIRF
jgi:hypothetical protein